MSFASLWIDLYGHDGDPGSLSAGQMALRAVVMFSVCLVLLRLGGHRILARWSAVDVVVAIALGSILSRVVNGSAPTVPTIVASATLVAIQRVLAAITWWSRAVGRVVKGRSQRLYVEQRADPRALARWSISRDDLAEAVRLAGYDPDEEPPRQVWLERDGRLSIIPRRGTEPRNVPDSTPRMG